MMEIILDTIDGSEIDVGFDHTRAVRMAFAKDIPAQSRSDPYVLTRAITESGGPQLGEPHPSNARLHLRRIVARPARGTNDAVLQYHYEGVPGSNSGSAIALLVVEDDTTLATEIEEVDPNGEVIQATITIRGSGEGSQGDRKVPKTSKVSVLRPRQKLTVSGVLFGRTAPNVVARRLIGKVNDGPWPTGSLWEGDSADPKGFWLCTHASLSAERYRYQVWEPKFRPYRIRFEFQSRYQYDWGDLVFYRDRYGNIPAKMIKNGQHLINLRESEYQVGQKVIGGGSEGVTKVGMYYTRNFPEMLGF